MCTLISKLNGSIGGSLNVAKKPIRVWKVVSDTGISPYQGFRYEMGKRYKTYCAPEFVTVYTADYNARRNNNPAEYPDIEDIKGIGITSGRFHAYTDEYIKKWLGSIPERHHLLGFKDIDTGKEFLEYKETKKIQD